jgi:SAM-dependent methyltransferase
MNAPNPDYADWRHIEYNPAISSHIPHDLVPFLKPGHTALEIGCGTGSVCDFLTEHGVNAFGIDINAASITDAKRRQTGGARFEVSDILTRPSGEVFDLVVMIRLLTCVPEVSSWREVLRRAHGSTKPGGLIWVHDFFMAPDSHQYMLRYEQAGKLGMRPGNFLVEKDGRPLFVAHHHSAMDLDEITKPYEVLSLVFHDSVSMNGNNCRMFRFLGRRHQ